MSPAQFVASGDFDFVLVVSVPGRAVPIVIEPGVVSLVWEFVFVEPVGAGNVVVI